MSPCKNQNFQLTEYDSPRSCSSKVANVFTALKSLPSARLSSNSNLARSRKFSRLCCSSASLAALASDSIEPGERARFFGPRPTPCLPRLVLLACSFFHNLFQLFHDMKGVQVNGEKEYVVEAILEERMKRKKKEYLVKWLGYPTPDWQPAENLDDTEALQDWLDGRKEAQDTQHLALLFRSTRSLRRGVL